MHGRLERAISLLLTTDDVRVQRLDVPAEVRNGLYFVRTTIWKAVPRLVRDVAWAARRTFGHDQRDIITNDLPAMLRYRSWIGGDRDGNPNVTADVTRRTLELMRQTALELWKGELSRLHDALSVSSQRADLGGDLPADDEGQHRNEPLRVKITEMIGRLDDAGYTSSKLLDDLLSLRSALHHTAMPGLVRVAEDCLLYTSVAIGDLDGDGKTDLAVANNFRFDVSVLLGRCQPLACDADLDGDGTLTFFDFLAFQNLFATGDAAADFDGDGELTLFDFLAFQAAFDAGCR